MENDTPQDDGRHEVARLQADLAACRANADLQRAIIDHTDDAITIKDRGGRYLYANPAALKLVDQQLEAIIGRTDADFFPPEALELLRETDQAVMAAGRSTSYEINTNSRHWGKRAHLTNKFPYYDAQGRVIGVVAVVRDITERKRAEEALKESESRFKGLVEATFDGIALHENGMIIEANQAMADMFGYPLEELIGMNGLLLGTPECRAAIAERFRSNDARPYEHEALRKDGSHFIVETVGRAAQYQGRPARVTAFRDITARKTLERQLRLQNEQLKQLDHLKSAFVGSVSHELRTPLTSIRGYAEFLEDGIGGELPTIQRDFVDQILHGAARLERLVDDLLDFARLESGTFKLVSGEADLAEKVRGVVHAFQPEASDRGVTLAAEGLDGPIRLRMDAGRIEQVLTNLISNAMKFTPEGGRIRVAIGPAPVPGGNALGEGAVRVSVTDTGAGVGPEHLPHLFDRFYQVDPSTTRQTGGTGLGLAISKALVEAHGGQIGAESTPGEGSTFWFTLPLEN